MTAAEVAGDGASSSTHDAHLVDATRGPLVGAGLRRRVLPFAATATAGTMVAAASTSWTRPGLAVVVSLLAIVSIIGSVSIPWRRVPRAAQIVMPFVFLVATLLLAAASGLGIGSPFVTMAILPLMWLAIYENGYAVTVAATLAGFGLWLATPDGGPVAPATVTSAIVLAIVGAGMGITLHDLVADARRLAQALRDNQVALEDAAVILDSLPERVTRYRIDDHVVTFCNAAWADQYHVDTRTALGRPLDEFLSEDELQGLRSQLALLGPDRPMLVDPVPRAADSTSSRWVQWVDRYVMGRDGPEVLSIGRDVTEHHEAQRLLAESEARFRDLAEKSADVVWRFVLEPEPHFDYMSPSVESILGYPPSYFLEDFTRMVAIVEDADSEVIEGAIRGELVLRRFDFRFQHANGSFVVGETRTTRIPGGLQGVSRDVTELRQLQSELSALALRDPLTGLANRRLLDELFDSKLARTQRDGQPLGVVFLDLDGFKAVNDMFGHSAGDMVLCETARRLTGLVRSADIVARVGGDEFVVVFEPNDVGSDGLVERIDRELSAPINISPTAAVTCPASIGVAGTCTVGYDSADLLAAADTAMYEAKRRKRALVHATEA
jgi:diguanylate cyclase (GGDEF)-like protein/PAS domain S-box-containing protein